MELNPPNEEMTLEFNSSLEPQTRTQPINHLDLSFLVP